MTLTVVEIEEQVRQTIAQRLKVDPESVKTEFSLLHELGADSLETVELIMDLEERFSMVISDEEAKKLTTVREVVDFIHNHVSKEAH